MGICGSGFVRTYPSGRIVVVVVVVCLASGWGWLSIATPSAARPEGSTPSILPKGEPLGGPEESLCCGTVCTTFSYEPTLHTHFYVHADTSDVRSTT